MSVRAKISALAERFSAGFPQAALLVPQRRRRRGGETCFRRVRLYLWRLHCRRPRRSGTARRLCGHPPGAL